MYEEQLDRLEYSTKTQLGRYKKTYPTLGSYKFYRLRIEDGLYRFYIVAKVRFIGLYYTYADLDLRNLTTELTEHNHVLMHFRPSLVWKILDQIYRDPHTAPMCTSLTGEPDFSIQSDDKELMSAVRSSQEREPYQTYKPKTGHPRNKPDITSAEVDQIFMNGPLGILKDDSTEKELKAYQLLSEFIYGKPKRRNKKK